MAVYVKFRKIRGRCGQRNVGQKVSLRKKRQKTSSR